MHLPKLIGALILVAAVLMFVRAGADTLSSWETAKDIDHCLQSAHSTLDAAGKQACQQSASYAGFYVAASQNSLTYKQLWSLLLEPIAALFGWSAVFVMGLILYLTGKIIIPVEERVVGRTVAVARASQPRRAGKRRRK